MQGGTQPAGDPPASTQPTGDPPAEPTIAQQVAEGVKEGVKAAISEIKGETKSAPPANPPADPPAEDPVTKGFKDLGTRLDGIDKRLEEQDKKIADAASVKAAAKGQTVPDTTTKTEPPTDPEPESKWAGSAVHSVFGKKRRTA